MTLLAFVMAVLGISSVPQRDPALAGRIPVLLHEMLTTSDAARETAIRAEAHRIFMERGLPNIELVGDEAAYEFVILVCSSGSVDERAGVLAAANEAAARHAVPADAAIYCEARLRTDRGKEVASREAPTHPRLRDEIERMFALDQAVRRPQNFDMPKMQRVDAEHAARLAAIFEEYGVPTYRMVGPDAASNFTVMIQHQDAEFRRRVLPKLKANVEAGQADGREYASMYDRSQTDQGLEQLYGQNLVCEGQHPELHEAPIEDAAQVDLRRARVGLLRLAVYVRLVQELSPDMCHVGD